MKILLSFLQDIGKVPHNIPAYRFWTYYIKNGIEEAGMEWIEIPGVDWAEGLVYLEESSALKAWRERSWEQTLNFIKKNKGEIDLFLSYLYPKQIECHAIQQIRKIGIPCVNFYCDHVREYTRVPDEFKVFDLMWVPEFEALPMYSKAKVDNIFLPMPMWIEPHYRNSCILENSNISFIGSQDELRYALLSDVISKGLSVEIRGSGWLTEKDGQDQDDITKHPDSKLTNQIKFIRKMGVRAFIIKHLKRMTRKIPTPIPEQYLLGKPDFFDYIKITQQSCITLGINRVPTSKRFNNNPLKYSRLRDIEAPMLGACYLTEYTKGLEYLYDIGKEIETYNDTDEMIYKCGLLLNTEEHRKNLRLKGQKRALNDHSIFNSLRKIRNKLYG